MDTDRTLTTPRNHETAGLRRILATREAELLAAKGPCSNPTCRLHAAHSGPCDATT